MALHAWLRKLHNKNSVGWTVFLFGAVNQYRCGHCNHARVQTKAIIRRPFGGGGLSSKLIPEQFLYGDNVIRPNSQGHAARLSRFCSHVWIAFSAVLLIHNIDVY